MDALVTRCAHAGIAIAVPTDAAVHAGTVVLRRGSAVDEVHAREVTVAALQRAADEPDRLLLVPRLRRGQRPHRGADAWRTPLPPWGMRLARLLRAVRSAVGDVDAEVRWADDGRTCRLIAVEPA